MKRHLRFLREHRRVLNLKVNAQEDLLLNERRDPTHRGVCQHLLSKVDRKRVLAAVERLEPVAGARLIEGVLGIAPDLEYVLVYLDCVRRTGAQTQAVAALSDALGRIDFEQVSPSQMRRLLDLIVELFDERQRPQVLLGLLAGHAFRAAFDGTAAGLPEGLAALVVPLRAAQSVVLQGRPNQFGADHLRKGARLLLAGEDLTLLRFSGAARRRLLELAVGLIADVDDGPARAATLLESLRSDASAHGQLGLELARQLIATGREPEARRVLEELQRTHPNHQLPGRWLHWLDAPRVSNLVLEREPSRSRRGRRASRKSQQGRLHRGVLLTTMSPVWVHLGEIADAELFRETERLLGAVSVPGICAVADRGLLEGAPMLALPIRGTPLPEVLEHHGGLEREATRLLCTELANLLGALASFGVGLPDARLDRFEVDSAGRPWLRDPIGLRHIDSPTAGLDHARHIVQQVLDGTRRFLPPPGLGAALRATETFAQLCRVAALNATAP